MAQGCLAVGLPSPNKPLCNQPEKIPNILYHNYGKMSEYVVKGRKECHKTLEYHPVVHVVKLSTSESYLHNFKLKNERKIPKLSILCCKTSRR